MICACRQLHVCFLTDHRCARYRWTLILFQALQMLLLSSAYRWWHHISIVITSRSRCCCRVLSFLPLPFLRQRFLWHDQFTFCSDLLSLWFRVGENHVTNASRRCTCHLHQSKKIIVYVYVRVSVFLFLSSLFRSSRLLASHFFRARCDSDLYWAYSLFSLMISFI